MPSKQPKFDEKVTGSFGSVYQWTRTELQNEPPYRSNNRLRDSWLRNIWRKEPHLAGLLSSVISIDKNRAWRIVGGRNVRKYVNILHDSDGGAGWRHFMSKVALGYYTTDIGAVVEIERLSEPFYQGEQLVSTPLARLNHVDSARCMPWLDGQGHTLRYHPRNGVMQAWYPYDYFQICSMPSDDESFNGLGYCALSRCLELTKIMTAIYEHDLEMLGAHAPRGLLLLQHVSQESWENAMQAREESLSNLERMYYGGVAVLASTTEAPDAKLVALSQLPANFDLKTYTDLLMFGYALCFGYPPEEFWPVQFGALGRGSEVELGQRRATSKGAGDLTLGLQEKMQALLPDTIHFEFTARDSEGERGDAELEGVHIANAATLIKEGILTRDEVRSWLVKRGVVEGSLTTIDEDVQETDTEKQRYLAIPEVSRCAELYPDEAIIEYDSQTQRERIIFATGRAALNPNRFKAISSLKELKKNRNKPTTDYQTEINDLIQAAAQGEIKQNDFERDLKALITAAIMAAFLAGSQLNSPADLSPEETDALQIQINLSLQAISGLATALYTTDLYTANLAGLADRIGLWQNSVETANQLGQTYRRDDPFLQWNIANGKLSCNDCLRLNGQVHRAREWQASGWYPHAHRLACKGFRCGCTFTETDGPNQGSF